MKHDLKENLQKLIMEKHINGFRQRKVKRNTG